MKKILLAMFLLLGVILPSLGGVSIFFLMEVVNDAADAIAAPGYHIVKFGHVNLDGDQFIFCAVTDNASVDRIRVSRYIFIQSGK
jgi:hypothetical protein